MGTSNSRPDPGAAGAGALEPKAQRNAPKTAPHWLQASANREEALWLALARSGITMSALAAELGLSVAKVSQLIKRLEGFKLKA